jgi:beta-glucosidase
VTTTEPVATTAWQDPSLPSAERVEDLLARLTLVEKLAQLGSYWDDKRGSDEVIAPMQDVFSAGRPTFDQAIAHGIGQLTRTLGTHPAPAGEGARRLATAQRAVQAASRFGIPAVAHEECLTGFTTLGATVYPAPLAWGASFDVELVERMAHAIGTDLRSVGVHQGLAPVLDVVRDYRWGRVEETVGEDPYEVAEIGSAYVRGLESAGVVATLKHFAGYSASRGGRNHAPVAAGPREVADVFLPPFEMAVREAGARSVMNSYAEIDGLPAAADRGLLTELLRDRWGFTGTVVSDYWSVPFLRSKHGLAGTVAEAGALALRAGLDVELPDTGGYGLLAPLVETGELAEADVDRAVRRVLQQKVELGLLDPGWSPDVDADGVDLDSPRNRGIARELAERSVVLLANDRGALPLAQPTTVALVGPCADDPRAFLGCYSYPVHVLPRHPHLGLGVAVPTLSDALRAELPGTAVTAYAGVPLVEPDRSGIPDAVRAARDADVVVAVVGDRAGMFGRGTSGEGSDAPDLDLTGAQGDLVEALLDTGTPVVLVVLSGRPYALGPYVGRVPAIVQAFFPGEEAAAAIAGVLGGRVNPSGHLPVQVPMTGAALPHTYLAPPLGQDGDRISAVRIAPAFPFGHGLSYTTFETGALGLDRERIPTDGRIEATVDVTNTGDRDGATVVQLYASDPVASVTRPVRQLVGFARVALAAGQTATVRFGLHADRFSFTGRDLARVVEPGRIDLAAGLSSADTPATATFTIEGTTRLTGDRRVLRTEVRVDHGTDDRDHHA